MRFNPTLRVLIVLAVLLSALPAVAQQSWDGYWSGISSTPGYSNGRTVSFDVAGNRIMKFVYGGPNPCNSFDTFLTSQTGYAIDSNGSFTINAPSSVLGTFSVVATGHFTASGSGSGSYNYTANDNAIPGGCSGLGSATFTVTRAVAPPAQQSWDGYWSGTSSTPGYSNVRTVSFDVAGNRITKFVYGGPNPCNSFDTFLTSETGYAVDSNGSFTISAPSSALGTFGVAATGHFTTSGSGSGSYNYIANDNAIPGGCSGLGRATFTVTRVGGAPQPPGFSVAGILAVVGSTPGNGAFFKTGVQIHNPRTTSISGKFVFHTQSASGSANDPSLSYTLAGGQTIYYPDLLPAMGVASGLGSLDIMTTGDPVPIMAARVFSDAGANGTAGFFFDPVAPAAALQTGDSGVLIAPSDPLQARLNLGIRSLDTGASFGITVRNKDGVVRGTTAKTYSANFFEQVNANTYVGVTLNASDTITFSLTSGKAIIYGSQTDNKTQDPSVQYAKKTF